MRGNWLLATSSTGGTGALTLANVTGWPNFSAMLGASGVRLVEYEIIEYTNAAKTTPAKFESGIGSLALSTGVLTRTRIERSYDGSTYAPNANGDAAAAMDFGTNANRIAIFCGPSAESFVPYEPFSHDQSGYGWPPFGTDSGSYTDFSLEISGTLYTFPAIVTARLPVISAVSLRVTAGSGDSIVTSLLCGLYEYDEDGNAGRLIADFGNLGPLTAAATLSGTLATPLVNPGAFYVGLLALADGSQQPKLAAAKNSFLAGQGINFASSTWKNLFQTNWGHSLTALPDPAAPVSNNNSPVMPIFGFK